MFTLLLAAAAATPADLKTFRDWTVGCDNGLDCKAVALQPEGGDREQFLRIAIRRGHYRGAPPVLTVEFDGMRNQNYQLRLDGKPFQSLPAKSTDGAELELTLFAAKQLGNGARLGIAGSEASASLAGLSAALRYIDDQQATAGTTAAMAASGPGRAVWKRQDVPIIVAPPTTARAPRTLTSARASQLIGKDNAVCDYSDRKAEAQAIRLDAAHSLALVAHPCGNGAYNLYSSAFVIDERGGVKRARMEGERRGIEGDLGLVNAGWDAKTRTLESFAKGRGLGDCGVSQSYKWDGQQFRLIEQTQMGECRGSIDYIRTWRATVR